METTVVVHGGAGPITDTKKPLKRDGCKLAAKAGYKILKEGGSVVDAVETAIRVMEDCVNFNADIIVFPYLQRGLSFKFLSVQVKMEPIIVVQGGAGDIPDERRAFKKRGCKLAAKTGYKILKDGGSIVDAVEAAIKIMEDDEYFNAGYGSVLNLDGEVEMDASIMIGSDLNAGAVTCVKDIKNPISLARKVMEKTPHVLLGGVGANKFAATQGISILPPGSLVTNDTKAALANFKNSGKKFTEVGQGGASVEVDTVDAVAIDSQGRLCAGTSTGGISGKMPGRASDTSQIGHGTYADDTIGAVSTTGHGETISKFVLAHSIIKAMEGGKSAQEATSDCISRMTAKLNNTAGAITLSKNGDIGVAFSSKRMGWAYQKGNEVHFGVDHEEHEVEIVN